MNFLRFLWWEGCNSEKAVIYRHRRMVFDVSCCPFLLTAVLNHRFKQAPEHLEKAAEMLKDSMYVDNCVASGNFSKEESFQRDSTELLALEKEPLKKSLRLALFASDSIAKPISVSEGLLPQDRVRDAAVFETIGLDLAGPLILKNGEKNWILILTCAVYRGIHLELLTSISIESFLLGLRRFIARRGRPFVIYSDNGTNFKGAYRLYQKVNLEKLKNVEELNPIPCKFIPPQAPWWGGFLGEIDWTCEEVFKKNTGKNFLES
ncbi:integrase catalytic domain-containing protein [Trichonephila clavipes]|nr:integrase catalytic domain-containing protein [Trichonephila clavipes]